MKKLIAAAVLGAAVTVGTLAGAGSANASSGSFLNQLNANNWGDSYRGSLLDEGYNVCMWLGQGYSYDEVVTSVYYDTNVNTGWGSARWFVNTAQAHLCR